VPSDSPLVFGPFRLDPASGHLYRDGVTVPLTPKAFSVLQHLAASADRLVSKQELLDTVWPGVFVGDAVLKVAIREVRKALGDNTDRPTFIETAHRRGYRFIAPIAPGAAPAAPPPVVTPKAPDVRYARSGAMNIAYQVIGSGPIDLVFVMGWVSHLEYFWTEPSFARFLTRLASMGRLIVFDKRGTGRSDPVPVSQLPALDERLDDVRAVMEAAGSRRAVLVGVSEGGPLCTLFAATYPHKTDALIMIGSYARRLKDADYPWGLTREEHETFLGGLLERWGGPVGIEDRAPTRASDPRFREWWATYLRMGASPGAAVALTRMNAQIDVRDVLPAVQVPTLVIHRTGDRCLPVDGSRYIASKIPGAALVELPGEDHLPFVGAQDEILEAIERFLAESPSRAARERVLATVLVVESDCRPADRDHLHRVFTREVAAYRGHLVRADGPLVAQFDGPGRAVRCGRIVANVAARSAIAVRAGIHIGECDPAGPHGPLLEACVEIAASAAPGDVLVTRTVVDLVHGSGLVFADRGALEVRALARPVSVLAVERT
jgi:pimeloyl-ACP methyl ester carboxylesterase/DNA-binding winged helix-turn-helix (wHTH) protein